jgi:hypothetical protein
MAKVAHMGSVEENITLAIKETIDFGCIESSGCLLHDQKSSGQYCEMYHKNCYSMVV